MEKELWSQLLDFLKFVPVILGVWMTYYNFINTKRLELFDKYVQRYNAIVSPQEIQLWMLVLSNKPLPEEKVMEFEIKMMQYLNLVWEEYHLVSQGLISKKLWKIWRPNIMKVLETDLAKKIIAKYDFQCFAKM